MGTRVFTSGCALCCVQERANVKMVMIQDSNSPSAADKPLRITGEPARCQVAAFSFSVQYPYHCWSCTCACVYTHVFTLYHTHVHTHTLLSILSVHISDFLSPVGSFVFRLFLPSLCSLSTLLVSISMFVVSLQIFVCVCHK